MPERRRPGRGRRRSTTLTSAGLQGQRAAHRPSPTRATTASSSSRTPSGGKAKPGSTVTIVVGSFTPATEPTTPPTTTDPGGAVRGHAVRVAVLAGGRSSEHDVSLASAASVREGLLRGGPRDALGRARPRRHLAPRRRGAGAARPAAGCSDADVVFPVLHGPFGEDGTVQGLLELLDVAVRRLRRPGVGGVHGQGRLQGPDGARRACRRSPTSAVDDARWREDRDGVRAEVAALGLPVLRQAGAAGVVGRHRARRRGPASSARRSTQAFAPRPARDRRGRRAPGSRSSARSLGPHDAPQASEPGRDRRAAQRVDRTAGTTTRRSTRPAAWSSSCPARISAAARDRVRELAVRAFRAAGCSGLARADFFVDGDDVLLNELNTMPGFTQTSVYGEALGGERGPLPRAVRPARAVAVERHAASRYRF